MFSFDFVYDFINLFLIWIMYHEGQLISKGRNYWQCCWWLILCFTLIEGVRYGRGVDYLHYLDVYNYDLEDAQVVFTSLNLFLKFLGIPAEYAFMVYAFPFIVGAVIMLKPLKKYAAYLFPLFLISIISIHESFIRQALAMSFYFKYINLLADEIDDISRKKIRFDKILCLLALAFVAYSIHSVTIIAIFVVTMLMVFIKKPLPWIYTVPLLILGKFVIAKSFDSSYLDSFLTFLGSSNEKFARYTENADRWFSIEGMNDVYTRNIAIQFLETFSCCALFYLGCKILNYLTSENRTSATAAVGNANLRLLVTFYNVSIIGFFILETFYNLEIVRRIAYSWTIFWFVSVSLILYYRKTKIFNTFDKFLMLGFTYWLWEYIRFLFVWTNTPMFIWDK